MKTSIIIPLFNQKDFFREAVESALAQTVPVEIIVVNDGSTDGSKFLAEEYADRVKVIHQVNKGLPSARNTGIMNATGEYILPLDADDILLPTAVERMEKVFEDTDADIVSPSFTMFGLQNQDVILDMRPDLDSFKGGNRIGYCSMFRRADLLEMGGYSPRMTFGYEDLALTIGLLRRGKKIYTIPEPLWKYRTKENSMIQTAQAHDAELMAQIKHDYGFTR
jgi:glycosyltransferase involved in cell wall biosynthesis